MRLKPSDFQLKSATSKNFNPAKFPTGLMNVGVETGVGSLMTSPVSIEITVSCIIACQYQYLLHDSSEGHMEE